MKFQVILDKSYDCMSDDVAYVNTEWPLMQQLRQLNPRVTLTGNDPYPTFMFECRGETFLFNETGEPVHTMLGVRKAYSFKEIVDVRGIINLDWKEGWK